jgi:hypothetical protein
VSAADERRNQSEERRRAYRDRLAQARRDGGSAPSEPTRNELLGKARGIVRTRHARLTACMQAEARGEQLSPHDTEPREWLPPGHVAVRAETLLGFEIELADVLASREAVERHRVALLGLMSRAQVPPGPGEIDLFKLESALATGEGLPRNAEAQLLEVVRELIRWRAAVPKAQPRQGDAPGEVPQR